MRPRSLVNERTAELLQRERWLHGCDGKPNKAAVVMAAEGPSQRTNQALACLDGPTGFVASKAAAKQEAWALAAPLQTN